MDILENLLPLVNDQIITQKKLAEKFPEEWRKSLHLELQKKFELMNADLHSAIVKFKHLENENKEQKIRIQELESKAPSDDNPNFVNNLLILKSEDLEGLPQSLLDELSESSRDKIEAQILEIINNNRGYITLDQLLIKLYKKTGEEYKRTSLTSRLYKMSQAGSIYSIAGRKGVYSTIHQDEK